MRRQWDLYTVPSIGKRPTCPLLELNWRLCHWVVLNFHSTPISSSELQLCGWHLSFVPSGRRLALHRSRSQKVKPRRFLQGGITAFPLLPRHRTTTSFQLQTNIGFYAIQSMIQLFTATPTPPILTLMTHFEVFRHVFFSKSEKSVEKCRKRESANHEKILLIPQFPIPVSVKKKCSNKSENWENPDHCNCSEKYCKEQKFESK